MRGGGGTTSGTNGTGGLMVQELLLLEQVLNIKEVLALVAAVVVILVAVDPYGCCNRWRWSAVLTYENFANYRGQVVNTARQWSISGKSGSITITYTPAPSYRPGNLLEIRNYLSNKFIIDPTLNVGINVTSITSSFQLRCKWSIPSNKCKYKQYTSKYTQFN
jgi:hypothetical protein